MKLILALIFPFLLHAQTTYYVSSAGSDAANGTSTGTSWKTPNKVTGSNFVAGDSILFNRGDSFYGELSKTITTATEADRIVFGAYGTGEKPIIYGDLTGAVWTATPGRDSIWQTFSGSVTTASGYENAVAMTNANQGELHFYLNNADSLDKFLDGMTASSFGWGNDTTWVKTSDGASPVVHVFLEANFIKGSYVTIRDIEFRNIGTAIKGLSGGNVNNMIVRNVTIQNTTGISIFFTGNYTNCIVDSCTIDSAGYTSIYFLNGTGNAIRRDTISNVVSTILGINFGGSEQAGVGVQEDTSMVIEYCQFTNVTQAGLDTYHNVNDTIRYCTVNGTQFGILLNGKGWVAHNNTVTTTIAGGSAIQITSFVGANEAYSNTVTAIASGQTALNSSGGGTVSFHNNTVTCTGAANTRFDDFQESGTTTSIDNAFFGTGQKFNVGKWPAETTYTTLAEFQSAKGYEAGSTMNEAGGAGDTLSVLSGNGVTQTILSRITLTAITDSADIRKSGHHGVWSVFSVPSGAWEQTFIDTVSTSDEFGLLTATVRLGGKTGNYVFRFTADEALQGSPLDITVTAVRNGSVIFIQRN